MNTFEILMSAGAVVTAFGIGAGLARTKIKQLQARNRDLQDLVQSETYRRHQWEDSATFWKRMYLNNVRRANGYEPKDLTKNVLHGTETN